VGPRPGHRAGSACRSWRRACVKRLRPPLRQQPEVGAVCGNAARTDLCGGPPARAVPTATAAAPSAQRPSGWVALAVTRQGSHRPGRARIRASGSSTDRFAVPLRSPRLSERVPGTWTGASMCSPCFPRPGLPAGASLPSPGSSGASSPASTVLSRHYDFLPPVPPHFVAFVWRYLPRSLVLFAPRQTSALPRPGVGNPVTPAGMSRRRRQDLPSSWGTSIVRLPCSVDAGRTAVTRPLQCSSVAPGM
jgi:hypothetical protein